MMTLCSFTYRRPAAARPAWLLAAILLLLVLSGRSARAQQFEPGYLVLTNGDTLRGQLENRYWEFSPAIIRCQLTADSITKYTLGQVRRFCLQSGRCFVADEFPLDKWAETRLALLPHALVMQQEPTRLFAEVLVEGPASLLRAPLAGATHYFVRRENHPYLELTERRYLRPGTSTLVEANNYVAQLEAYFGDCPAVGPVIQRARFTAEGLTQVVQAYNAQCSATRQAGTARSGAASAAAQLAWNAGVVAGAHYGSFALTDYSAQLPYSGLAGQNIDNQVHPQAGFYADLLLGGRHVGIHGELVASRFGSQRSLPARNGVSAGSYEWRGTQARLRVGLRLFTNLSRRQRQFLVGAGTSQSHTFGLVSSLRYGTASRGFLAAPYEVLLPYGELGLRQQRFTFTVDVRLPVEDHYEDRLGALVAGLAAEGSSPTYRGRYVEVGATVAYRLLPGAIRR